MRSASAECCPAPRSNHVAVPAPPPILNRGDDSGSIHHPIRGRIDRLAEIRSKSDRLLVLLRHKRRPDSLSRLRPLAGEGWGGGLQPLHKRRDCGPRRVAPARNYQDQCAAKRPRTGHQLIGANLVGASATVPCGVAVAPSPNPPPQAGEGVEGLSGL
jgi:hypothetical protein